ncbi:hypothetical protein NDU88_005602 [Pleurodeles waltl]|uniref:Uncharacterized protein n=1 Tax=Pleurodeles waltl TaxID=8319 RepID=A0AAV7UIL1_PLEWA|nr:hypothetical protein NDU88_005602 [Pleurodeles waltl]
MAHATGERAPAFTAQELEKLVDGVFPQYALLYGPPDQQVSTLGPCFVANACVEWGGCKMVGRGAIDACIKRQMRAWVGMGGPLTSSMQKVMIILLSLYMSHRSAPTRKSIFGVPSPRTSGPWGSTRDGHPLPEEMGGHPMLEQEDGGGSAGDGLPTWEGCPSYFDPPDVPDPGGGLPRFGWAREDITADTRG